MSHKINTIIISDLHLGTAAFNRKKFLKFLDYLEQLDFNQLIINGDLFDLWYTRLAKIVREENGLLVKLVNLLDKDIKIIYLVGNHDIHMLNFKYLKHPLWYFLKNIQRFPAFNKYLPSMLFSQLTNRQLKNLSIKENHKLKLGQRHFFITHGHMFDLFTDRFKRLSILLDKFNLVLYFLNRLTLPIFNFKISVAAKKGMVSFAPAAKNIKKRCFKYLDDINRLRLPKTKFNSIIIGHLHWPEIIYREGYTYYNSGDWIDSLSWLEIKTTGEVTLKRLEQVKINK